jgi:hypothetical protein
MRAEALAWLAGRLDWEDRLLDLEAGSGEPGARERMQSPRAERRDYAHAVARAS